MKGDVEMTTSPLPDLRLVYFMQAMMILYNFLASGELPNANAETDCSLYHR